MICTPVKIRMATFLRAFAAASAASLSTSWEPQSGQLPGWSKTFSSHGMPHGGQTQCLPVSPDAVVCAEGRESAQKVIEATKKIEVRARARDLMRQPPRLESRGNRNGLRAGFSKAGATGRGGSQWNLNELSTV